MEGAIHDSFKQNQTEKKKNTGTKQPFVKLCILY